MHYPVSGQPPLARRQAPSCPTTRNRGQAEPGPARHRGSLGLSTVSLDAVRTPAAAMTSLANAADHLDPRCSLRWSKQAMPAAHAASATPAQQGTSGPITTNSASTLLARPTTASADVMSDRAVRRSPRSRIAGGDRRYDHLRIPAQRHQQGMLTGTGTDHEDSHGSHLNAG